MSPRFLADHDLHDQIVSGVHRREPACEFIRCRDLGLKSSPDLEVLKYAAENDLIVVSHDVNTMSAAAWGRVERGERMGGLILVAQNVPLQAAISDLLLIWSATEAREWTDQVVFLPLS